MANSGDLIDFSIIEGQKENIQALPSGRSARALANLYAASPLRPLATPTPSTTNSLNDARRVEFEAELDLINESDDPLDIYDRYVTWTLHAYPAAQATKESQLLPLLERASKTFLNSTQYKNDPRYLKIWLSYIRLFSDAPRETFTFLARHNIGDGLALFYEEFAAWLENAARWTQAQEIFELGIQKEARPAVRLLRKFQEFQQRYAAQPQAVAGPRSPALPPVRAALAPRVDPFAAISATTLDPQSAQGLGIGGGVAKSAKKKLQIFSDVNEPPSAALPGTDSANWESIGSLADRRKENYIEPKAWAGETLKVGGKRSGGAKLAVFKDQSDVSKPNIIVQQATTIVPSVEQVTMNPKNGRSERILVNLGTIYPSPAVPGTEMSFEELQARQCGWLDRQWQPEISQIKDAKTEDSKKKKMNVFHDVDAPEPTPRRQNIPIFSGPDPVLMSSLPDEFDDKLILVDAKPILDENGDVLRPIRARSRKMKTIRVNETQIIRTKLSSPSGKKVRRKNNAEPTMTIHTKAATDEIYDMFNATLTLSKPSHKIENEDDVSEVDADEETDGDYTSGAESTGTGRFTVASEADDNDDDLDIDDDNELTENRSISEWSQFTTRKHVPDFQVNEHHVDIEARLEDESEPGIEVDALSTSFATDETVPDEVVNTSYAEEPKKLTFISIPSENYIAPTHRYRNADQISQNRLPFMTPIAEKTESSLGQHTSQTEKEYFNSKTPSKANGIRTLPCIAADPMSSPFQELVHDTIPKNKISQPVLFRSTNIRSPIKQSTSNELVSKLKGPLIKDAQCNPVEEFVRTQILTSLQPPLSSYEGFYDHSSFISGRASDIRKYAKAVSKMSRNSADKTTTNLSMPPILSFPDIKREYTIKRELGAGAFAPVYLIESDLGVDEDMSSMAKEKRDEEGRRTFEALKMEDPPTPWEFYITRLARRRLGVSRAGESIIRVHEMHLYRDECFLIEEYRDQGTLLDLVNIARADSAVPGGVMDEALVMFFAIELFRTVEALHAKGILHGDLKADNCLVRLLPIPDNDVWTSQYRRDGSGGWSNKGVSLIDFGRGIDMKAFIPSVQFIADWKTTPQDCAEMRELRPWTYQIDYHGLAGIIHSLLFGKYMETVADKGSVGALGNNAGGKTFRIRETLKRYWQTEIWSQVFELLLNPMLRLAGEEAQRMPVLVGMRAVREAMEEWLERNCERGVGLQAGLRKLEYALGQRRR